LAIGFLFCTFLFIFLLRAYFHYFKIKNMEFHWIICAVWFCCVVIVCAVWLVKEDVKNNERKDRLDAQSFIENPRLLSVIHYPRPDGWGYVSGITVLDRELFVVRSVLTSVEVYNTNNFTLTRNISITGLSRLRRIVASPRYNCLYISDTGLNVVHRYNLSNNVITKWSMGGGCSGLSLTSTDNVLVTMWYTQQIQGYTPDGRLIRKIKVKKKIVI